MIFINKSIFSFIIFSFFYISYAYSQTTSVSSEDIMSSNSGIAINQVLMILRNDENAAGNRCLVSLKNMQKAQSAVDHVGARNTSDVGLATDVLESDMEEVLRDCGKDAAKLCAHPSTKSSKLRTACTHLPPIPEDDNSETPIDFGTTSGVMLGR